MLWTCGSWSPVWLQWLRELVIIREPWHRQTGTSQSLSFSWLLCSWWCSGESPLSESHFFESVVRSFLFHLSFDLFSGRSWGVVFAGRNILEFCLEVISYLVGWDMNYSSNRVSVPGYWKITIPKLKKLKHIEASGLAAWQIKPPQSLPLFLECRVIASL